MEEQLCCLQALKMMTEECYGRSFLWNTRNEPNLQCSDPYWQRNVTTPSDLSFLLTSWSACEIMPQVFLSVDFFSAICLSLRAKGKQKEQEPWKIAFHSSYFLSFRDITTRARASSSQNPPHFRNFLCVWKSCPISWKEFAFSKFSESEHLRYHETVDLKDFF